VAASPAGSTPFFGSTSRPARTALFNGSGFSASVFATAARGCPSANSVCARVTTSGVSTGARRVRRAAKNAWAPPARSFFTYRFMLIELIPNARTTSACVQDPFTTN